MLQLCSSFDYYSPDSHRDIAGCTFDNNYYGGLTSSELKSRLREVKFAYRLDQKYRQTYKVRACVPLHWPDGFCLMTGSCRLVNMQQRAVYRQNITDLVGVELPRLLDGSLSTVCFPRGDR